MIKLTKHSKLKTIALLMAIMLIASAIAVPAYADGGTVTLKYSPDITGLAGTEFTMYKVGEFDGPNLKLYDEYLSSGADVNIQAPGDDASSEELSNWQSRWLSSADLIATAIDAMETKPEAAYGPVTVTPGTTANLGYHDNGLYLIKGAAERVGNEFWTPVPVLVMVLNGNTEFDLSDVAVKMKSATAVMNHTVRKVWEDKGFEAARPESITVDLICNEEKVETVTLSDDNNWTYTWESDITDGPWSVMEVFGDEDTDLRNYYIVDVVTTEGPEGSDSEIFTITNTFRTDELEITKTIDNYLEHDEIVSTAVVFDITGYASVDGNSEAVYHNQVGTTFNGAASKTVTISNIPMRLDEIKVKEIYAANYRPSDGQYEKTAIVTVNEDESRKYSVSFTNVFDDRIVFDGGVVNKYEIKDGQYKITERQGLSPATK